MLKVNFSLIMTFRALAKIGVKCQGTDEVIGALRDASCTCCTIMFLAKKLINYIPKKNTVPRRVPAFAG